MRPATTWLAAVALAPATTGPVAAAGGSEIVVALCAGGTASIPLDRAPGPGDGDAPACAKGCHASPSRKRVDRAQCT